MSKPLSADLAEMAIVMRVVAAAGDLTPDGAQSLAESFRRYSARANALEVELRALRAARRAKHVDGVADSLGRERAIRDGVVACRVIDLREAFAREQEERVRGRSGTVIIDDMVDMGDAS